MTQGFLGTAAPVQADIVLLVEVAMGAGLLAGAWLARAQRFKAHACCQSTIVILNTALVALTMLPSFHEHVFPKIPARLNKAYYALSTTHAVLGAAAELTALYILLSAGTQLVPHKFRIKNFKLWMRTALALWWATLLLGVATYARWYIPGLFRK